MGEPVSGVPTAPLEDCDLVVFANLTADSERVLGHALAHQIPIVCANPDVAIWDRAGVPTPKAGSLARRFEALGATVYYAGKPNPGIFRRAAPEGAPLIGDSPHTDLAGALAAGMPSIWLRRRVHADEEAILERYRPSRVVWSLDELDGGG
jgi:ribonucleotide monophosphatase NagD (HAD superfamily)